MFHFFLASLPEVVHTSRVADSRQVGCLATRATCQAVVEASDATSGSDLPGLDWAPGRRNPPPFSA